MLEIALVAFTTFFATIGPLDVAALFAVLTMSNSAAERRQMALRGAMIGTAILLFFALLGDAVLAGFGISLAALRTAGGALLFLIAIDMVFARSSGSTSTTDDEEMEAQLKKDISVFPIGTPLIAGPGAIGAAILLMAEAQGDVAHSAIVLAMLIANLLLVLVLMLLSTQVYRLLGVTGLHVISRVVGVLLAALAVQFMFDGIDASGLLKG